jgi:hypothetical protein
MGQYNPRPMFDVKIKITDQHLVSLFSDADGGSAYWAELSVKFSEDSDTKGLSFEERLVDHVMNKHSSFIITDVEENEEYIINKRDIERALQIMSDDYPEHFSNLIKEEDDADTGDVFLQILCFDEVVYG